jgi:hypothetical protein
MLRTSHRQRFVCVVTPLPAEVSRSDGNCAQRAQGLERIVIEAIPIIEPDLIRPIVTDKGVEVAVAVKITERIEIPVAICIPQVDIVGVSGIKPLPTIGEQAGAGIVGQ